MDGMRHDFLEHKLCEELDKIQEKYMKNPADELSETDIKRLDLVWHALKSKNGYERDAIGYGYDPQMMSGGRRMTMNYANDAMPGYSGGYMPRPRW